MSVQQPSSPGLGWEDLRRLPEDGRRFELWDGALHELSPGPSSKHQAISMALSIALGAWARAHGAQAFAAPLDVVFRAQAPGRVVQPDLVVLLPEHASRVAEFGILGAPDVAEEILSPSSMRHDLVRKADRYAQEGVRSYWIVRPSDASVEVWPLGEGGQWGQPRRFVEDMVLVDELLPGFALPLTELFA